VFSRSARGKEASPVFAHTGQRPQDQGLALKALNLPSVQGRAPFGKKGAGLPARGRSGKTKAMPEIHVERFLPFPPERVYALAKDLEGLKPFLPDIQTLRVLGREGNRTRTEWVGVAMGKKVRWIEEEEWDDAHLRNRFWSPEGDFDRYEGTWAFLPENGGTRVVLDLTYELTLPLFGSLLKQLVHKLMQENAASLLKGLEDRVRAG